MESEFLPAQGKKSGLSGFIIERTARKMKLFFSRVLLNYPDIDITVDQWVVLEVLSIRGSMSQTQLCEFSFKDAPTVTRIIDILSEKGYVERGSDNQDRRKFLIHITDSGLRMVDRIMPLLMDFRSKCYEGINEYELESLQYILDKIYNNLKTE
jgi:DNA-binding MarR family transcriptional regulator